MIGKVSVIGAGSLGTAIAQLVSNNAEEVFLHARRKETVETISKTRRNLEYYPNTLLSQRIKPLINYDLDFNPEIIFLCVPSSSVRVVSSEIQGLIGEDTVLVSTAKGVEYPSTNTMSEIIFEKTGERPVIFSGPNFASEIILNLPTITTIASEKSSDNNKVKDVLSTDEFLVETTDDIVGTEWCSILKNINAIAYGVCEGMKINDNAKFAVLNRGFNEIKQIVTALGGDPLTVDNYCGFGDMILTATSDKSRNHTLGMIYGQRISIDESSSGILFEGKKSAMAVKKICERMGIESLVTEFTFNVLNYEKSPKIAFRELWGKMVK